jgi:Domain of unknown function (DU1801)
MPKTKTTFTNQDVSEFVNFYVENEQKKLDSFELIKLMQSWTGEPPMMWGPTIIGFGNYHYKYESGHEGDAPVIGFSPRKAAFSLYVFSGTDKSKATLKDLGKFKMGKSCIYIKKLSDINLAVLEILCKDSIKYVSEHHECSCRAQ